MNKLDLRYQRLLPILEHPAKTKIVITSRGTGKSYSYKYWILEQIEKEGKEFIWLRRQFDSIRTGSLESWKRVIANYCVNNKISEKDIELVWDAITRGIKYKGTMKCFMVELFSSYKARENYTQTISEIVFDEAIVNPSTGEKYLENEAEKINELVGSAWRSKNQPKPTVTYLANPYERFRPFMNNFLPIIRKQLNQLQKRLLANEIIMLENQDELLFLYQDSKSEDNWSSFFAKEEDLKITEFINGSTPQYVFNDCILYLAKKGYQFFVHKDNKEISNKEEIINIPEYYINNSQRLNSKQVNQFPIEENYLREDLLWQWQQNNLRFCPDGSREIILEFMSKGKV